MIKFFAVNRVVLSLLLLLFITSCAASLEDTTYDEGYVGETSQAYEVTVLNVRKITIKPNPNPKEGSVGNVVGGVSGGVIGSTIGKGDGNKLATLGGAIIGSIVGSILEGELSTQDGWEYLVKMKKSDNLRTVIQTGKQIPVGSQAYLILGKGDSYERGRLIPASSGSIRP
jgi:outer membrane lipoprotein SlyB